MAKKLRVRILFGGRSGERQHSLLSTASILISIDRDRFNVVPIGIIKKAAGWRAPMRAARAHMEQLPLVDVVVLAKMGAPHASCVVGVSEAGAPRE